MERPTSVCGIYECEPCEYRQSMGCPGCRPGNLRPKGPGHEKCAVAACAEALGIASCAECSEGSCLLRRSVESICPLRSRFENKRWWAGRMSRALEARKRPRIGPVEDRRVSGKVVNRLRWYLTALDFFDVEGLESVSSWQLAERVGVSAALIRKDLSRFGDFGTPSLGYRTDLLREKISAILRLDKPRGVVWVGARCFGLHAAAADRLTKHECRIAGVFDVDPEEIGQVVAGQVVLSVGRMVEVVAPGTVQTAVLAVSGPDAQAVAGMLSDLGVGAILNLSGELLVLPDRVRVCNFDLVGELLELCYYCVS